MANTLDDGQKVSVQGSSSTYTLAYLGEAPRSCHASATPSTRPTGSSRHCRPTRSTASCGRGASCSSRPTAFNVGTGFSDAEREKPPPIGATITFRYQELSPDGVPRFPTYVRERPIAE